MIAPVQYSMYPFISYLVGYIGATITKNAPCHVQLYIRTDIFSFKCSSFEFIAGSFFSMIISKILQITFTGLVADRAIQRMIDQ